MSGAPWCGICARLRAHSVGHGRFLYVCAPPRRVVALRLCRVHWIIAMRGGRSGRGDSASGDIERHTSPRQWLLPDTTTRPCACVLSPDHLADSGSTTDRW